MALKTVVATLFAIAALASSAVLAQESTPGASPNPNPNLATVVFFRAKALADAAVVYGVREGAAELGRLRNASYFTLQATVGRHQYTVHSEGRDVLTLDVAAGATYYVIGGIPVGGLANRPNLAPSDAATFEAMKGELEDLTGHAIDED
jgi:hypothetical protein